MRIFSDFIPQPAYFLIFISAWTVVFYTWYAVFSKEKVKSAKIFGYVIAGQATLIALFGLSGMTDKNYYGITQGKITHIHTNPGVPTSPACARTGMYCQDSYVVTVTDGKHFAEIETKENPEPNFKVGSYYYVSQ